MGAKRVMGNLLLTYVCTAGACQNQNWIGLFGPEHGVQIRKSGASWKAVSAYSTPPFFLTHFRRTLQELDLVEDRIFIEMDTYDVQYLQ